MTQHAYEGGEDTQAPRVRGLVRTAASQVGVNLIYYVTIKGHRLFYLDPHHSWPAVPFDFDMNGGAPLDEAHHTCCSLRPETNPGGVNPPPDSKYARAGSMSPDSFTCRESNSPDFGHEHGLVAEDGPLYVRRA
ncbi:hypothetical protein B0H11DRAFT_1899530 [Mycena galericulata]|nr:hypothetical protein B0H11DRAFT_1899530 [Mycena galericulata]